MGRLSVRSIARNSTAFFLSDHLVKVDSEPSASRKGTDGPWIGLSTDGDKWWQVMKTKEGKEAWTWGLAMTSLSQPCDANCSISWGIGLIEKHSIRQYLSSCGVHMFTQGLAFFFPFYWILYFNFNYNPKKELLLWESRGILSIRNTCTSNQYAVQTKNFAGVWKEESAERVESLIPWSKFYFQKNLLYCSQYVSTPVVSSSCGHMCQLAKTH